MSSWFLTVGAAWPAAYIIIDPWLRMVQVAQGCPHPPSSPKVPRGAGKKQLDEKLFCKLLGCRSRTTKGVDFVSFNKNDLNFGIFAVG